MGRVDSVDLGRIVKLPKEAQTTEMMSKQAGKSRQAGQRRTSEDMGEGEKNDGG